jgi:hypothetical protein
MEPTEQLTYILPTLSAMVARINPLTLYTRRRATSSPFTTCLTT